MFSKATEYALRAAIYIAQKGTEEHKIGIDEIAKAIDSPAAFTAKILQTLRRDNTIIRSVSGPHGGFYMTEKAKLLPVRAIIDAMGERDTLEKCVLGLSKCSESKPCPMHAQYKPIKKKLLDLFDTKTIDQLARESLNAQIYINNRD